MVIFEPEYADWVDAKLSTVGLMKTLMSLKVKLAPDTVAYNPPAHTVELAMSRRRPHKDFTKLFRFVFGRDPVDEFGDGFN